MLISVNSLFKKLRKYSIFLMENSILNSNGFRPRFSADVALRQFIIEISQASIEAPKNVLAYLWTHLRHLIT